MLVIVKKLITVLKTCVPYYQSTACKFFHVIFLISFSEQWSLHAAALLGNLISCLYSLCAQGTVNLWLQWSVKKNSDVEQALVLLWLLNFILAFLAISVTFLLVNTKMCEDIIAVWHSCCRGEGEHHVSSSHLVHRHLSCALCSRHWVRCVTLTVETVMVITENARTSVNEVPCCFNRVLVFH